MIMLTLHNATKIFVIILKIFANTIDNIQKV